MLFPVVLLVEVLMSAPLKFYLGVLLAPKLQLEELKSTKITLTPFPFQDSLLRTII